jgi:hypothetical protein
MAVVVVCYATGPAIQARYLSGLPSVAVLALVCSAPAFILFFALIAEIGHVRATVIT